MRRERQRGSTRTGLVFAVLLLSCVGIGVYLWQGGMLPFRLRPDGIYAGNSVPQPEQDLPVAADPKAGHFPVVKLVDGDTLDIKRFGRNERIRLIGIDCPESDTDEGRRAAHFVRELLAPNAQVRIETDKEHYDKYERKLAYVYLPDGRMLNEVILQNGWARVMTIAPNTAHRNRLAQAEEHAKQEKLGIWKK